MIIKSLKYAVLFTIILIGIGCLNKAKLGEKFKTNNPATGIVNGQEWKFQSGVAFKSEIFGVKDFTIHLIDTIVPNPCDRNYTKILRVSIAMTEVSEGKFDILDLKQEDEFNGVSFFDPEINSILDPGTEAMEGTFEITSVDTEKKLIKGSIDVEIDDENKVKGNFIVEWCPDI